MYESLELEMSETKQNHTEICKILQDHKKELENKDENTRTEIANLQQ